MVRSLLDKRTTATYELPRVERTGELALVAEGLTVQFGSLVVLNDVSFEVKEGSRTGLIGPNGAGKTTAFNVLSGLLRPVSAQISITGTDITEANPAARAAAGLARTFQMPSLVQELSVGENLLIGRHRHKGRAKEAARTIASLCEIDYLWDEEVKSLSFGQQRLVEIARAVCAEPTVLALDEPAAGLDSDETATLTSLLFKVQNLTGVAILLIEHDMDMVMEFCDYLYVLDFGQLLAQGTPAEIRANQAVLSAYLGRSFAAG